MTSSSDVAAMIDRLRDNSIHHRRLSNEKTADLEWEAAAMLAQMQAEREELNTAFKGAILYGPNTVSVQGDNGPFDSNAGRIHIWFKTYRQAVNFVAALGRPQP